MSRDKCRMTDESLSREAKTYHWLTTGCLAGIVLLLISVTVPPAFRKVLMFPVFCGALYGYCVKRMSGSHASAGWPQRVTCVCWVVGAFVISSLVGHERYARAIRDVYDVDPTSFLAAQVMQTPDQDDGNLRDMQATNAVQREEILASRTSFDRWLAMRLENPGRWGAPSAPWPWIVWISESLAAAAVALWLLGDSGKDGQRAVAEPQAAPP